MSRAGLGAGGGVCWGAVPPSHLGVGLEATCDHPFPTSFWKRLSRLMSKVNPEPNVIHVMGCYVLGNPNGEKVQHPTSLQTPFPSQLSQRDPRAWPHYLGLLALQPHFPPPPPPPALPALRARSLLSALPQPQDPHDSVQGHLRVAPGAVGSR